jgi:hypothetical protein
MYRVASCFNRVLELKIATNHIKITIFMLQCVEVSSPKTINITQYLNTNNFSVNNRHIVIKISQATQFYITILINRFLQVECHLKQRK